MSLIVSSLKDAKPRLTLSMNGFIIFSAIHSAPQEETTLMLFQKRKVQQLTGLVFITLWTASCTITSDLPNLAFKQEMRDFVILISDTAHFTDSSFIVIPQNGQEIMTSDGEADGNLELVYMDAIDGTGREDLFFGYTSDDIATPESEKDYMMSYLDLMETSGVEVLVTDYCSTYSKMDTSYSENLSKGFISFAADQRNLNNIPDSPVFPYPHTSVAESNYPVTDLSDARNFLYLINSENYSTKRDFIDDVKLTNYDMIIMDLYHNETAFTNSEIDELKTKHDGGTRLVMAYMSIGEAEDYRYYWNDSWKTGNPIWLDRENPDWAGNYKVRYWEEDWQDIILTGSSSYLGRILAAGFDGVYLDIIDGFEYFENY